MIVQANHVPRLKYGQWLDIRQAERLGWGSEEWGINNRTLGVDCHFKLEGVGCFYELRSKTWANRLIGDRMRTRVVFHLNAKSDPIGKWVGRGVDQSRVQRYNCAYEPRIGRSRPGSD